MRRPATPRQRRTWCLRRGVVLAVSPCIPVSYSPVYLYIVYCIPWYTYVYCIVGYTRITLCGILWYSVVVWSSRFPSAPTPLIISPPPPIGIVFIRRSQHSGEKTRDYRSAALFSTSPSDPLDVIPVVAIYMLYWYDIKHMTQMTRYLSRYAYPNSLIDRDDGGHKTGPVWNIQMPRKPLQRPGH